MWRFQSFSSDFTWNRFLQRFCRNFRDFSCYSDFTWNQLRSIWSPKIAFFNISAGLNIDFFVLLPFSSVYVSKYWNSKLSKLLKWLFLTFRKRAESISGKIQVVGKVPQWVSTKIHRKKKKKISWRLLGIEPGSLACTMLQKLTRCEVKARLCWNLIMLPPLRFYVKSTLGEFERLKNVIFGTFRGPKF